MNISTINRMEKIDYIFIDFDGTLLEGKHKHYNCYRDIVNNDGGTPLDIDIYWEMKRNKVTRDIYLEKSYYEGTYEGFLHKWINNIEDKKYLKYDILKENVIQTLKEWKQYANKLVLITMRNNEENLYWQLNRLGIKDLLDDIVICRCIENKGKYEFVKDYKFNKAVVVGDTEDDIELALSCKIKSIVVTNGLRDKKFLKADFYADEVKDIDMQGIITKIYHI